MKASANIDYSLSGGGGGNVPARKTISYKTNIFITFKHLINYNIVPININVIECNSEFLMC